MRTSLLRWYYKRAIDLTRWYCKRAIETLRYEGPHILPWHMLRVCLSPLGELGLVTFCQKDLTQALSEYEAKVEHNICQATESDLQELVTLYVERYSLKKGQRPDKERDLRDIGLEEFGGRLKRGDKCFVGKIGTEIAHYNWIFLQGRESVLGTRRFINLRNGEAFCDDGYTAEALRGKGIHTVVHRQMLLFLQQEGYRRAYTVVPTFNKSSKKTLYRLEWNFSGIMLYFIPRRAEQAWIWRIRGTLDPFVENQIPTEVP
jgi:hypothetical protein